MFILSSSSSSLPSPLSLSSSRVSLSPPSSSFLNLLPLSPHFQPPNLACSCSVASRSTAELLHDFKHSAHTAASADETRNHLPHSRAFLDVRSEQELLSYIRREAEAGKLPANVAAGMEELYQNYKNAVLKSGNPKADEIVLSNMTVALDRILLDVEEPFVFSPHHKAVREPFDYYTFGQNYVRPLIDFENSFVGNPFLFKDIEEKLHQGHNVVLISNHQTEADPAIISLLLEKTSPYIAENMIYVAGDRVIVDPLCKPFSIGRNLICVYSKKHMFDIPELAETKRKANTRSLKEMALLLRGGSQLIWIAPSGGRDRLDPSSGEWSPAPFDASSMDNMRRLIQHSGVPGHLCPLALLCYDIMPPPSKVEIEIGEKRVISFNGVGLSLAPAISFEAIAATHRNPDEAREAYSEALFDSVAMQYNVLKAAIYGRQALRASTADVSLSQPWM
ncbi:glycerol-3-phosphate acyltransferase, chloroplastic-like [Cucurbita maxima]|uniref:Glycerol-3-phosphate acyltransferase, chloroplastic n=1 Tax=Cucurbita maxima TaxID=3661 RepID=A0A6J1HTX9_CUCMA|nr:glycerol-3-phosphate acyltransferase, chloroplastic-like [Cucurbita maxima]XP_022967261.1 glycerol-3-phosphate acyltransferase, chloroplastic-like [Cucurbita maxima]